MDGQLGQALLIEPKEEIHFKGPYSRSATEYFRLTNPTDKLIAFKVRTNAPKQYCVRPNSGVIRAGGSVSVVVISRPLSQGANTSAEIIELGKHKFMIQSVFTSDLKFICANKNADELFKTVKVGDVMDTKIRCVFDDDIANMVPSSSDGDSGNGVTKVKTVDQVNSGPPTPMFSPTDNSTIKDAIGGVLVSNTSYSCLPPTSSVIAAIESKEIKRLQDEKRDLQLKLSKFEKANKTGGRAYNRFATSSLSSVQEATAASEQESETVDYLFPIQMILTAIVSLLIGFIIGKIDFGEFF